jgi:hypothetical protein
MFGQKGKGRVFEIDTTEDIVIEEFININGETYKVRGVEGNNVNVYPR